MDWLASLFSFTLRELERYIHLHDFVLVFAAKRGRKTHFVLCLGSFSVYPTYAEVGGTRK